MLTPKELLILATLRKNSRESLTMLSKKVAVPISTVYDKIKNYEQDVIIKNTCLLNFSKLGYQTRATIMLKIKKEDRERVRTILLHHKHVNSCYKIINTYDYLVEGIFRDLTDVQLFVEELEAKFPIENKDIYYIVEEVKKEDFLSSPDYIKLIGGEI